MIKGKDFEIHFSHDVVDPSAILYKFSHITECEVIIGDEVVYGTSYCMRTDQFQKSVGRKLALTRALENLDKETRAKIWTAYFEKVKK